MFSDVFVKDPGLNDSTVHRFSQAFMLEHTLQILLIYRVNIYSHVNAYDSQK